MRIIDEGRNRHGITWRILEHPDTDWVWDNLEGDMFDVGLHSPAIPEERILREQREFRALVEREGVYGYELQRWDPEPGIGWRHEDSCWGFSWANMSQARKRSTMISSTNSGL